MSNFSKLNIVFSESANTFEALLNNALLCDLMTAFDDCLCKVSKVLAEFNEVFEKFLIYVLRTIELKSIYAGCHLYFLTGNITQNVNNGKFSNVNNEFNMRNVRNYSITPLTRTLDNSKPR